MALSGPVKIMSNQTAPAAFWRRVAFGAENECWNWTGPSRLVDKKKAYRRGVFNYLGVCMPAHQFAAFTALGRRPPGLETLHACDNPLCCNPKHLSYGTHQENVRQCFERGRNTLINRTLAKTICVRGHPLSGDNLYVAPSGAKTCRSCRRERKRIYRSGRKCRT